MYFYIYFWNRYSYKDYSTDGELCLQRVKTTTRKVKPLCLTAGRLAGLTLATSVGMEGGGVEVELGLGSEVKVRDEAFIQALDGDCSQIHTRYALIVSV